LILGFSFFFICALISVGANSSMLSFDQRGWVRCVKCVSFTLLLMLSKKF